MSKPKITNLMQLVEEYQSGVSSYELAEKYTISVQGILRWLRKAGCPVRNASESQKTRYLTKEHPWTGRKHNEETKAKMSANHADVTGERNPNFGKGCLGEKNGKWKGGITPESRKGRNTKAYIEWRDSVFERDNRTCQLCGSKNKSQMCSHHIINWLKDKSLRFIVSNGITLCRSCHTKVTFKEEEFILLFSEMVRLKELEEIYGV